MNLRKALEEEESCSKADTNVSSEYIRSNQWRPDYEVRIFSHIMIITIEACILTDAQEFFLKLSCHDTGIVKRCNTAEDTVQGQQSLTRRLVNGL